MFFKIEGILIGEGHKKWSNGPQIASNSNSSSRACAQPQAPSLPILTSVTHVSEKAEVERGEGIGLGGGAGHSTSKLLALAQSSAYLTTKPCAPSAALPRVASHPRAATVPAPLTPNRGLSVTK